MPSAPAAGAVEPRVKHASKPREAGKPLLCELTAPGKPAVCELTTPGKAGVCELTTPGKAEGDCDVTAETGKPTACDVTTPEKAVVAWEVTVEPGNPAVGVCEPEKSTGSVCSLTGLVLRGAATVLPSAGALVTSSPPGFVLFTGSGAAGTVNPVPLLKYYNITNCDYQIK